MKIIISPAKTMCEEEWYTDVCEPVFYREANELLKQLKTYTREELYEVLKCNDTLLELNYKRFQGMNDVRGVSAAIHSYIGLQYQHIASNVLEDEYMNYLNAHLRIISGFYGLLKANDGIRPYRLEMKSRLKSCSLYDYWGSKIHDELYKEGDAVLNLASKEYSVCIEKYLKDREKFITVDFKELVNGKWKMKATQAKMARGDMVRYIAENKIEDIEKVKRFNIGYTYNEELSNETHWVFVRV